jgi:dynein heavy chain
LSSPSVTPPPHFQFQQAFDETGPLVKGLEAHEALDRLNRMKGGLLARQQKFESYRGGETLFALEHQQYPELEQTAIKMKLASLLFDLYRDVDATIDDWNSMMWPAVISNISEMREKMDSYEARYKKLPKSLRGYHAASELRTKIEDFQAALPLLQELAKDSIRDRHWTSVKETCKAETDFVKNPDFVLKSVLDANIIAFQEDIEEITEGADKQLKIERELNEVKHQWAQRNFELQDWVSRDISILKATLVVSEELEEAQMKLNTNLSMRHIGPFEKLVQDQLDLLNDTSDTLDVLCQVQSVWCSLESVFTGGDIAKQMPREAKKFSKVDKDWVKIMSKIKETMNVVECCNDEGLKALLPSMKAELEKCQKSLEGYLLQKQNAFPRFFFVSDAKLLKILSQGSDPLAMNQYYESLFDAIQSVEHNKDDSTLITKIHGAGGDGHEIIPFTSTVQAKGNVEEWLMALLRCMQKTMKAEARKCARGVSLASGDVSKLRLLVDQNIAQFALLAVQLAWTHETETALEECQTKQGVMQENNVQQQKVLQEMSKWCVEDLGTNLNRTKIETLIVVHVHQRDIAEELLKLVKAKKVKYTTDFDWLKQARFYWSQSSRDDVDDDGATIVSITDVDFKYQYEYLGPKERLVITPLTDKCYITLAQALGMYYGGAPAGPAGTGKVCFHKI